MPSIPGVVETLTPILDIRALSLRFQAAAAQGPWVVDGLHLSLMPGERLALVGESGSGKTVSALSILGLLTDVERKGEILWKGEDLAKASDARMRQIRGREIALVFQEPMTALNPLLTVGRQVGEVLETHEGLTVAQAQARAVELLDRVGLDDPERRARAYPHQLSGGQRQRVLIAMALACRPALLIADEPTTALDVSLRQQVLDLLADLQREEGMAILLITHDLPMVRRFAQRVCVMQTGRVVEQGAVEEVFRKPTHPYTQRLIQSQPKLMVGLPGKRDVLLDVRQLHSEFLLPTGWFYQRSFTAVHKESFVVSRGETLGVVGESGSGKTTLGMSILRLGVARVTGHVKLGESEILSLSGQALRAARRGFQPVFQDPYSALSPRLTIRQILEEGLVLHHPQMTRPERLDRCRQILDEVGLAPESLGRYPHEFSGGQRQRIAIARAVVVEPELIVLDEPTSALDVSIQQQILELLVRLQERKKLTYVFISHDLAVIRAIAHRCLVMQKGRIVEFGPTHHILRAPRHPYTQQLLDAAFPEERQQVALAMEQADWMPGMLREGLQPSGQPG
jgi:microcin C transport system ATP-binding protein